jgi:hypothetical protein
VSREPRDRRVQPTAGDHQQREACTGLFVMDANVAFFVERHLGFSSPSCGYDLRKSRTRSISSIAPNGRIMLPLNNVAWGHYAKLDT